MEARPSGTVTFLLTDVEGSTRLWETDADAMRMALAAHDVVLQEAVESRGGWLFKHTGDGVCAVFSSARGAIDAAIDAQRRLTLPVRMGIGTGEAEPRGDDYFGPALNRAARVMGAAHGGQILVAASTAALLDDVELVDMGEYRLRDLSGPHRLFQVRADGLRTEFPVLRTVDSVPGNLPAQLSSFVGRDSKVLEVVQALRLHRLVTLTGVGGVGKTRLALQVAGDVLPQFPDGVWLVELAPVSDPDAVGFAAANTLGITQQPGLSAQASVAEALVGRRLLLVVDNCEHVLTAAAELIELVLQRAPTVTVLATSREGVGVAGEQAWPVPSLETGADSAANRLFVDRASEVVPGYDPSGEADAVIELCQRLDGIPLAIELAAARLRSMSATQIRDRLNDRFRLLTGGSRRGLRRHQTLQQAVQWSYDLLDDTERAVLCRAAVFAGGFTLAAADTVCSGDGVAAVELIDVLDSLVRKSLVNVERTADAVRYRLLETIREFAENQLAQRGGLQETRNRHASTYAAEADHNLDVFASPHQRLAFDWFDVELANLRAAFRWSLDNDHLDTAARIAISAGLCGGLASMVLEPVVWAEEMLEPARAVELRCLPSLYGAAAACFQVGRFADAIAYGTTAVALDENPDFDPDPLATDYMWLGSALGYSGEVERAIELWRGALDSPQDQRVLFIRTVFPFALAVNGRDAEARLHADATLAAAEATGIPSAICMALHSYGRAYFDTDPSRALAAKRRCVTLARESRNYRWGAYAANELAELEALHGDPATALRLLGELLDGFFQAGHRVDMMVSLAWLAVVFEQTGNSEAAATIYGIDGELLKSLPFVSGVDDRLDRLRCVLGQDRFDDCIRTGNAMDRRQAVAYARGQIQSALGALTPAT